MGDFNIPSFKHDSAVACQPDPKAESICNFIYVNNLISHNEIVNIQGNTLDLVMSTNPIIQVQRVSSLVELEDGYHPPLAVEIPIGRVKRNVKRTELCNLNDSPNYAKADFLSMYKLVSEKH